MSRTLFNAGWQYRVKSNPFAEMGQPVAPFIDVALPHDATIGIARDPDMPRGAWNAFFPGGVYEYRKAFDLPEALDGQRVLFEFEGIYRNSIITVNGVYAGQRPSGYSRFVIDASDLVHGGSNEIRVEARSYQDSRWYAGVGIHRDVWMHVLAPVHIAIDGVKIRSTDIEPDLAVVEIQVDVVNDSASLRTVEVGSTIVGPDGRPAANASAIVTVPPREVGVARLRHYVADPTLWDLENPALHTSLIDLVDSGKTREVRETSFGIRRLQLDPKHGLRVNGRAVKLRGACIHHDNGIIGSATIARADERRVEILKQAGFNAIRSAHNPMSRALLDACDKFGMLVMDEAFDMWTQGKTEFGPALDFAEWWERDLEAMVATDFNHPSVVFYSIGNEIPETGTPMGGVWGRRLAEKVRSLDDTRFVTNGINGMLAVMSEVVEMMAQAASTAGIETQADGEDGRGINSLMTDVGDFMNMIGASETVTRKTEESFGLLDVAGMNYLESRYESDRELFPNRLIIGTETFPTRIARNWNLVERNDHVLGDFTWTGWDYLGEVGIGRVRYPDDDPNGDAFSGDYPWLVAGCGDIDITGFRRPASYYREIVFGLRSEPYIAVQRPSRYGQRTDTGPWAWTDAVSSWSWGSEPGRPVVVEVYSDADEVELLVNGRSMGRRPAGRDNSFRASFDISYEPGVLSTVAYRGDAAVGRSELTTATGTVMLRATADRSTIRGDLTDLAYVAISFVDEHGYGFVDDREVSVTISGPATLQGLGSSDPATTEAFTAHSRLTFDGRALAAVRPTGPGDITVTVTSQGVEESVVILTAT